MVKNPLKRKSKEKSVDEELDEALDKVEELKSKALKEFAESTLVKKSKKKSDKKQEKEPEEISNADVELDMKPRFDLLRIFGYLFILIWVIALGWFIYTLLFSPFNPYIGIVPPIPIDDLIGKKGR